MDNQIELERAFLSNIRAMNKLIDTIKTAPNEAKADLSQAVDLLVQKQMTIITSMSGDLKLGAVVVLAKWLLPDGCAEEQELLQATIAREVGIKVSGQYGEALDTVAKGLLKQKSEVIYEAQPVEKAQKIWN